VRLWSAGAWRGRRCAWGAPPCAGGLVGCNRSLQQERPPTIAMRACGRSLQQLRVTCTHEQACSLRSASPRRLTSSSSEALRAGVAAAYVEPNAGCRPMRWVPQLRSPCRPAGSLPHLSSGSRVTSSTSSLGGSCSGRILAASLPPNSGDLCRATTGGCASVGHCCFTNRESGQAAFGWGATVSQLHPAPAAARRLLGQFESADLPITLLSLSAPSASTPALW